MKSLIALIYTMLVLTSTYSQTNLTKNTTSDTAILISLTKSMKNFEKQFNCEFKKDSNERIIYPKYVSEKAFESIFRKSQNRVLGVTDEVANNGKGATLEFNEALKRISISHNWFSKDTSTVFSFGFTAEDASKKTFEIFGKKGWKDGFQLSFGQQIPLGKRVIYFLEEDCEKQSIKRQRYYNQILSEYQQALSLNVKDLQNLEAQDSAYQSSSILNLNGNEIFPSQLTEQQSSLLSKRRAIDKVRNKSDLTNLESLYSDSITNFIVKNVQDLGYKINWLTWAINGGLARFNVYDTAIARLASVSKKNLPRISGSVSYNILKESATGQIIFGSIQLSAGNTNYLEEILPSEIDFIKSSNSANQSQIKETYDAIITNDYDKLKQPYGFLSPSITGVWYPRSFSRMGRFLGIEASASAKFKLFNSPEVPARDLLNSHFGLLFTFEQKKIAKTTVALLARITNMPLDDFIPKKYFNIGIRLGVPFNY